MNQQSPTSTNLPLAVDLDGTLVRTDLLHEGSLRLAYENPLSLPLLPFWLVRGKATLKARMASLVGPDPETLPYHAELLDWLRDESARGREVVLVTAAPRAWAEAVASYLGLFAAVLASEDGTNLSGETKARVLVDRYGEGGYAYVGNSRVDLPAWRTAGETIVVNPGRGVLRRARRQGSVARVMDDRPKPLRTWRRALRLHQWAKNLLVFVPFILGHRFDDPTLLLQGLIGFLAFSLCASSVYVLNDLVDLDSDRRHPTKRRRPFAAGDLPVAQGVMAAPILLLAAFALAAWLPAGFAAILAGYYATTLAYSLRLKRLVLLDAIVLAGLYIARLLGGAAATEQGVSFWLLAFGLFLFFSLALAKRHVELRGAAAAGGASAPGRGYGVDDLETLASLGSSSGIMTVLVLALYVNSEEIVRLYTHPEVIWLLCPLLLYWIARIWLLTRRGELHEDPVVFALTDRTSHLALVAGVAILWLAL